MQLRGAVPSASVADGAVAVAAEAAGASGGVVEILTSDRKDFRALAGQLSVTVDITYVRSSASHRTA